MDDQLSAADLAWIDYMLQTYCRTTLAAFLGIESFPEFEREQDRVTRILRTRVLAHVHL